MRELLVLKFSQNPFKQLLLNTGNLYIQEGNKWGDTFWGVDLRTNVGENNLGKLIMSVQEDLKREAAPKKIYENGGGIYASHVAFSLNNLLYIFIINTSIFYFREH